MSYMFKGCSSLTELNVTGWDLSKVTGTFEFFSGCNSLTVLDLSSWDTSNVTDMSYMFSGCNSLTTIYVSNLWSTENVAQASSGYVFLNCNNIIGQSGTIYDASKTDISMANWETGYLTYKAN